MELIRQYDNWDNPYYEMKDEDYNYIYRLIYDGLRAAEINDNELLVDAIQDLGKAFGVVVNKKAPSEWRQIGLQRETFDNEFNAAYKII